jgi:Anaphase-promoting complex subunit 11 RING-H2 finger
MANEQVRAAVTGGSAKRKRNEEEEDGSTVQAQSLNEDSDCPICFDSLKAGGTLTFCRGTCGANFHMHCIQMWIGEKQRPSRVQTVDRRGWKKAKQCQHLTWKGGTPTLRTFRDSLRSAIRAPTIPLPTVVAGVVATNIRQEPSVSDAAF